MKAKDFANQLKDTPLTEAMVEIVKECELIMKNVREKRYGTKMNNKIFSEMFIEANRFFQATCRQLVKMNRSEFEGLSEHYKAITNMSLGKTGMTFRV